MARQFVQPHNDPAMQAFLHPRRTAEAHSPRLLLHSGRHHPRFASRSFLATPRAWFRYHYDGRSELLDAHTLQPLPQARHLSHRLWHDLRRLLHDPSLPGPWIGYLAYNVNQFVEPDRLAPRADDRHWPAVELAWCPDLQTFPPPTSPAPRWWGLSPTAEQPTAPDRVPAHLSNFTRPDYEAAVQRVLDYIAAGDAFQVNLAQRFTTTFTGDPRRLFQHLAQTSPAWYGAALDLPPTQINHKSRITNPPRALLSTSPELFLELQGRDVTTRPIKGTRPASGSPDELAASEKDAAELHMIVDLMRNDLGRVCDYGSIRVPQPRTIESHPTVHHGVATVTGRLHPSRDVVDLLRATLPGGSVTGAPKIRAMQIIDELEPAPRGPYCGTIGLLAKDHAILNIAIRTLALTPPSNFDPAASDDRRPTPYTADFWAGGGIVADSDPAAEYEETRDKAAAIWHALNTCANDET